MIPTEAEIASMRETAETAFPTTASIQRRSRTSTSGGYTDEWEDITDDPIACRISPVGGGEGDVAGERPADETTHIATFAAGTDIEEIDQVTDADDVIYEVTRVAKRGEVEITRRVEMKEKP